MNTSCFWENGNYFMCVMGLTFRLKEVMGGEPWAFVLSEVPREPEW